MKRSDGITEQHIQAILMNYLLTTKRHKVVIPNSNGLLPYEADLISFTRDGLCCEYEIKLDKYDYEHDSHKPKHSVIPGATENSPAYFWYVTFAFGINPPKHAGWLHVDEKGNLVVKKDAPRHNTWKMDEGKYLYAAMTLSACVSRMYLAYYFRLKP
jgi:hypothetical protein